MPVEDKVKKDFLVRYLEETKLFDASGPMKIYRGRKNNKGIIQQRNNSKY
jgi:hypothetical protein